MEIGQKQWHNEFSRQRYGHVSSGISVFSVLSVTSSSEWCFSLAQDACSQGELVDVIESCPCIMLIMSTLVLCTCTKTVINSTWHVLCRCVIVSTIVPEIQNCGDWLVSSKKCPSYSESRLLVTYGIMCIETRCPKQMVYYLEWIYRISLALLEQPHMTSTPRGCCSETIACSWCHR